MKKFALLLFALVFSFGIFAQLNWIAIADSINRGKNLVALNERLNTLRTTALAGEQYALAGRCWLLQLQIADRRTEDTLFWANSFHTDSLLHLAETPPKLRSILAVLHAKRIIQYRGKMLYNSRRK
ncbi:MAG: hypothetical protein JNM68_01835, partial [Dinghuibacter sp.]|nr:hypothetical protein [Dinghuibacter sp.]